MASKEKVTVSMPNVVIYGGKVYGPGREELEIETARAFAARGLLAPEDSRRVLPRTPRTAPDTEAGAGQVPLDEE